MRRPLLSTATTCLVVALSVSVILALPSGPPAHDAFVRTTAPISSAVATPTIDGQIPQGEGKRLIRGETGFSDDVVVTVDEGAPDVGWYMAGANPQRTSWTPEEVRGNLEPAWYRPIEPYISQNVQIIAAEGKLFISTARGLYALNAANGDIEWIYPTELPLGHSPTYHQGVLYVGGFDRRLHAIDAASGNRLWTFDEAKAGYRTNPLIVDGLVLLGNRDGWFYAIHAHGIPNQGQLAWKHKTDGPILYSAAYKDGVVFFASQDMHAYALYADTGQLKWKSDKLHGAGFNSWWPVIWSKHGKVVLRTSPNYRQYVDPGAASCDEHVPEGWWNPGALITSISGLIDAWIVNSGLDYVVGTEPGDWVEGTKTIDATPMTQYYEAKPWRRTMYVLDIETGEDWGFDYDGDGKPEYAPMAWHCNANGNGIPAPPMISGFDDVLYLQNLNSDEDFWRSGISGWKIGTPFISEIGPDGAHDEPRITSGGGSVVYWNLCCDRTAGGIDISQPSGAVWQYYNYDLEYNVAPGYDEMWFITEHCASGAYGRLCGYYDPAKDEYPNGIYHNHGMDQNPLVPYNGHLYVHRSNGILAFEPEGGAQGPLPLAEIQEPPRETYPGFTTNELKQILADEIQEWVNAGHLHPGWLNPGQFGQGGVESLTDYFQNPAENIWVLLRALPHLPPDLQQATRGLLQSEYQAYDPTTYAVTGWSQGITRDWFLYPPEVEADLPNFGPSTMESDTFRTWHGRLPPINFYVLWKYAEEFGGAAEIFNAVKTKLSSPPDDTHRRQYPFELNAYIAGYWGYLELEKLAGQPESTSVRNTLNEMLAWRANNFTKDTPFPDGFVDTTGHNWGNTQQNMVNLSRNFIYMTPELGQYLHDSTLSKVQEAVDEYNYVGPYWFVSRYEGALQESTIQNLHDTYAVFQAKAWILKESREELLKYLDVPGFMRGDLFYIHNLISAIENWLRSDLDHDCDVDIVDIMLAATCWGTVLGDPGYDARYDLNQDGRIDVEDIMLVAAHWGDTC